MLHPTFVQDSPSLPCPVEPGYYVGGPNPKYPSIIAGPWSERPVLLNDPTDTIYRKRLLEPVICPFCEKTVEEPINGMHEHCIGDMLTQERQTTEVMQDEIGILAQEYSQDPGVATHWALYILREVQVHMIGGQNYELYYS